MTINKSLSRMPAVDGDGQTTSFDFHFRILEADQLLVITRDQDGVETVRDDYTVSGVGADTGGSITFSSAPGEGETVHIILDPKFTQEVSYQADEYEKAFDKQTQQNIRVNDKVNRSLKVSETSDISSDGLTLTPKPGEMLIWDENNNIDSQLVAELGNVAAVQEPLLLEDNVLKLNSDAPKNKFDATSAPTVNHDSTQGYSIGSKLLDTANDHLWICFDATEGAADWRMISGAIASLGGGNVLTFNPDSDFEWIDLNGKHRTNVNIFRDWPGVQLHPTANGGFGYIDFVKHDRPNQDFQFRLRSGPTSEQMVFEHYDANDVYSHIYSLTGDGNIWSKSYGWLHDKFAAKDDVSAWEHIQTISTSAPVLDFTFQNLSQYRALKLSFDVRPDTDHAQLWLRTSRDNGANFDAGPSDYGYVQHFAWHAGHGYGGGHSSTAFVLAANLGNASSAYRVAGELQLTELNKLKRTYMKGEYFNLNRSPDLVSYGFGGLNAHAEANDAIRIFFNAGQIAEGFVTLEGIKG